MTRRWCAVLVALACSTGVATAAVADESRGAEASEQEASSRQTASEPPQKRTYRGEIVWFYDAIDRLHQVQAVPEARERIIALRTDNDRLVPIVEDVRGRAFRRDERLRELEDVELLARRVPDSPFVQIIRLYSWKDGTKYELDYWCDVCAIAMFELKPCDCCQGPVELRRREVETE